MKRETTVLVFHTSVRSSWNETLAGLYRFARPRNWNVQVIEHEPDRKSIENLLDFWRPSGVIVEGGMDEKGVLLSDVFGDVPVVYLACNQNLLPRAALRVSHDSVSLGRTAVHEFLSLGLVNFAFFGFSGLFWSEDRLRCYQEALQLNGRTAEVFRRHFFESGRCELEKGSRKALTGWLKSLPKPCGLLAANDLLATEVISVARSVGIKIPDQLSVLGIDNDELACENATPTLSSIRPNFEEAGFLCAQLLDARLSAHGAFKGSPHRTFSAAGIMRRQSTRRLPRANADVSKAIEIIRLRACSGLKPRDVFPDLGCSRRLAEVRFRELTGHTVWEEIAAVRLAKVKELLARADIPLETIASQCGWQSTARLRVFFHEMEGVSMREWRKNRFAE